MDLIIMNFGRLKNIDMDGSAFCMNNKSRFYIMSNVQVFITVMGAPLRLASRLDLIPSSRNLAPVLLWMKSHMAHMR
jgi:hypothetical protein